MRSNQIIIRKLGNRLTPTEREFIIFGAMQREKPWNRKKGLTYRFVLGARDETSNPTIFFLPARLLSVSDIKRFFVLKLKSHVVLKSAKEKFAAFYARKSESFQSIIRKSLVLVTLYSAFICLYGSWKRQNSFCF